MKKIFYVVILILVISNLYSQENIKLICQDSTKQDIRESIAFYNGRLSIDSLDQISYYDVGMCYYKLKEYSLAIKYFDKLISLNPKYPDALSNRGICKLMTKQIDGTYKDFE